MKRHTARPPAQPRKAAGSTSALELLEKASDSDPILRRHSNVGLVKMFSAIKQNG